MKEFGYYIYQGGLAWPIAGFVSHLDAERYIRQLREDWPGSTFRLTDVNGYTL